MAKTFYILSIISAMLTFSSVASALPKYEIVTSPSPVSSYGKITRIKPLIDSLYNTDPGTTTTFAMGSSMGALASMYLLCEYPGIFGGAACMSTHWIGSLNLNPDYTINDDEVCAAAILQYLSEHLPADGTHRLYMDQGTIGWDAGYLKYEVMAREIAREKEKRSRKPE